MLADDLEPIWHAVSRAERASDATQMTEAIQEISREFHEKMVAYIRTVSVDVISPVQVQMRLAIGSLHRPASRSITNPLAYGFDRCRKERVPSKIGKMYVESAPYLMDPVKLGAHLGERVLYFPGSPNGYVVPAVAHARLAYDIAVAFHCNMSSCPPSIWQSRVSHAHQCGQCRQTFQHREHDPRSNQHRAPSTAQQTVLIVCLRPRAAAVRSQGKHEALMGPDSADEVLAWLETCATSDGEAPIAASLQDWDFPISEPGESSILLGL